MKKTNFYLLNRLLLVALSIIGVNTYTVTAQNGGGANAQMKKSKEMQAKAKAAHQSAKAALYNYESVPNDPMQARIYTLANGMKVYLSVNKDEPRVQTAIAVRTGAKNDPRDNTGLAHYLEHMLFKGTDRMATTDWEKESALLKQISDLYEKHKKESDPAKKAAIYKQIDELSHEASTYSASNEYDKMVSSLGAKYTNAYTSTDETVYINNIPANELEKWLMLESERFRMLVLRLFHTELETVYEEFNMSQDRDGSKVYQAMLTALFKKHPYQVSTIGLGEHLKNPSHEAIHAYFDKYYVANNMAICLSGDIDPDATIKLINHYFGKMRQGEVEALTFEPEDPITEPIEVDVIGKEAEQVTIAYRFDGAGSRDDMMLDLMDGILQNGQAGLMDLNLIQKQKILKGGAFQYSMIDYSLHQLRATPREGQSLEEVKDLLLEQIELIKKGDFPDWLIGAVIKDYKYRELKGLESNWARSRVFVDAFIAQRDWKDVVNELDMLSKVTKDDIVKFANEKYGDNYAVIYKRNGEDKKVMKVDKPPITQVELNRDAQSEFYKMFEKQEAARLEPLFLDYKKDIQKFNLNNGIEVNYIKNKINPTFSLYYILDMGTDHDQKTALAVEYLPYLGTEKYTAEQLQGEFYKLGLSFEVSSSANRTYIQLSGLEESLTKGVELFEHILANVKPDEAALNDMIDGILKERVDAKKDKRTILWGALYEYGKNGKFNPSTNKLSEEALKALTADELVKIIKGITAYEHYIFYYGQNEQQAVGRILNSYHEVPKKLKPYPAKAEYVEQETDKDRVLFVDYDMVQANIIMMSKDAPFDKSLMPQARVFREYFGSGLSSIVFQEIREARALAYSAFASYSVPSKPENAHYSYGFLAVQADKMKEAITTMRGLLDEMPKAEKQFESAKVSTLKQIESERITKNRIFFDYLRAKDRGLDYDVRKDIYEAVKETSMDDLEAFFNKHIADKNYTFLVIGKKADLDMEFLKSLGELEEVTLEEIFGY